MTEKFDSFLSIIGKAKIEMFPASFCRGDYSTLLSVQKKKEDYGISDSLGLIANVPLNLSLLKRTVRLC